MNQEPVIVEQEEEGISLIDIINVLKRNWILILISILLFGLLAGGYAFGIAKPKYKSEAEVLLQVEMGGNVSSDALLATQRLLGTAPGFIKSPYILSKVIENVAGLEGVKTSDLAKNLTASTSNSTNDFIIRISYLDTSKERAQAIVSEILDIIESSSAENFPATFKGVFFVLSPASEARYASPNKTLYVLVGLVLGGVIGVVISFGKLLLNTSYQTKEQLELGLNIQVIGIVPAYEVKEGDKK